MSTLIRTTENAKSTMSFDALRLPVGEVVKLETNTPSMRFKAIYTGSQANQVLILSLSSKAQYVKKLAAGTQVTLRFVAANMACALTTRVIKTPAVGLPLLFLEYPKIVNVVRIRQAIRVKSKILVSLDKADSSNMSSGWPRQALCADISLQGARLEASDLLGEVGSTLMMTARMPVGNVDQLIMIHGLIRNVEDFEDPISGDFRVVHGVEFVDITEEASLVLSGFVYQQMLKELGAI